MAKSCSGTKCAVSNCHNYSVTDCSKSFYTFPKDHDICRRWVASCNRRELQHVLNTQGAGYMHKHYKMCSIHFTAEDFRNPNLTSQGLKNGSIPSRNLSFTDISEEASKYLCDGGEMMYPINMKYSTLNDEEASTVMRVHDIISEKTGEKYYIIDRCNTKTSQTLQGRGVKEEPCQYDYTSNQYQHVNSADDNCDIIIKKDSVELSVDYRILKPEILLEDVIPSSSKENMTLGTKSCDPSSSSVHKKGNDSYDESHKKKKKEVILALHKQTKNYGCTSEKTFSQLNSLKEIKVQYKRKAETMNVVNVENLFINL